MVRPCTIGQPDQIGADALLPDTGAVLVGVQIEDTPANALVPRNEIDHAYLSLFRLYLEDEIAGRFGRIGNRTISTTLCVDP